MARPRALARRAARLFGYWRSERRTFRQGLVALVLSTVAGFLAGLTLAHLTGTLEELPGLLVLIPAAVGMKGTIFGAIGARLGTAKAAGILTLDLRPGGVLRRNVDVAILTTFSSALWLAVLTRFAAEITGQPVISLRQLLVISVLGGTLGSILVLLVTVGLSALSTRLDWDLDAVSTPMVTALGDMTTIPSLFLASTLVDLGALTTVLAALCLVAAVVCTVAGYRAHDATVRRIVMEMTATILLTPILDVAAGALEQARLSELSATPVLLALIPPFVSQAGALGGIFSSRTTSKLEIGVITPRGRPETPTLVDAGIVLGLAIVIFAAIGSLGWAFGTATGLPHMPSFTTLAALTLGAGLLVTPITLVGGYALAVLTYRLGLDPDNQGVPIITSVMDLAGVWAILFVMAISGVI
ncbi:MAG TPA: magnesium transporter [Actinomycetota bacterium]|jgi:mgtE-like transporter